ncbi:MAG: hypothetical protein P8X74_11430, partial [Reinekea sp.]
LHRSQRAELPHWAPTSSIWRKTSFQDTDEHNALWVNTALSTDRISSTSDCASGFDASAS